MSSQQSQGTTARLPKWSPNLIKQGPLKATIPMSGVLKPSSNIKTSQSPTTSSPTYYKTRNSPDHMYGQRSPGSSLFKGKSKQCTSDTIRRTASLDTLYLKGQWPRDNFYWHTGTLQIDKATQTDEADWSEATRKIHCISENDEKSDIFTFRGKLRGNNKDSNSRHVSPGEHMLNTSSQTLASCILSPTPKISPVNIPNLKPVVLPKSSIRSSVEALNQEIERIVLKTGDTYCGSSFDRRSEFRLATPEGHRAPLAEMLRNNRSRSVNTQTPQEFRGGGSCHSSGESHGSSPDTDPSKLGTSPHINKFLAREPPDGCEKVHLKSLDDKRDVPWEHAPQPSTFKLRPSLGSAFHILQPDLEDRDRQESPLVPSPDKSCN